MSEMKRLTKVEWTTSLGDAVVGTYGYFDVAIGDL